MAAIVLPVAEAYTQIMRPLADTMRADMARGCC